MSLVQEEQAENNNSIVAMTIDVVQADIEEADRFFEHSASISLKPRSAMKSSALGTVTPKDKRDSARINNSRPNTLAQSHKTLRETK